MRCRPRLGRSRSRKTADAHEKRGARRYAPGQRIPQGYRAITDYRSYGLPDPGRGYRYVRYDDDVYKIAIQTATVAALIGALPTLR